MRIERLGGADELSPALVLGRAPALFPLGLHPALGGQHLGQLRERADHAGAHPAQRGRPEYGRLGSFLC
jgi:hypothetical protein